MTENENSNRQRIQDAFFSFSWRWQGGKSENVKTQRTKIVNGFLNSSALCSISVAI